MLFFSKTIGSVRADTLETYVDTNTPDTFGKGLFSFPAIYLGCNLFVCALILLCSVCIATGFNRKPDTGYAHSLLNMHNNVSKCRACEKQVLSKLTRKNIFPAIYWVHISVLFQILRVPSI